MRTLEGLLVFAALVVLIAPFVALGMTLGQRRRLDALRREVEDLRRRVDDGPGAPPVARKLPRVPASAAPPVPTAPPTRPAPAAKPAGPGLESFVGGRVLLVVGVVAVLLALAFFFKLAIDRGWIGPGLRIAMGVAAGVAALVGGDRLRARGYGVYGHAIMGAGLGALFLCTFVSALRYGFVERTTAFVLCAGVTALGAGLATWRRAPLLAWLGFLGGFAAPALLGRNEDSLEALTGWLVLLDLGLVALLVFRPWRGLEALGALASVVYFGAWHQNWFAAEHLARAGTCLTMLYAAVMALTLAPAWLGRRVVDGVALGVLVSASLAAYLFAHDLFWPDHRFALAAVCGAAALVAQLVGRGQESRHGARSLDVAVLDAFTLAGVVVALGLVTRGDARPLAWCATGLVTVTLGVRLGRRVHALGGLLSITAGALEVLRQGLPLHEAPFLPVLNIDFVTALAPCASFVFAARLLEKSDLLEGLTGERPVLGSDVSGDHLPVLLRVLGLWGATTLVGVEVHEAVLAPALGVEDLGEASRLRVALLDQARTAVVSALSVVCVLLAWGWGRRAPAPGLLPAGPLAVTTLLSLGLINLTPAEDFTPLLNGTFGAQFAVVVACLATERLCPGALRPTAAVTAGVLLLVFLTDQIWTWGLVAELDGITREQARFRAHVVISSVWTVYGALLLAGGFLRRLPPLRWAGLVMLLVTVVKVFLVDLARLDTVYRIGSFLVLGVLLVGAAFFYQRSRVEDADEAIRRPGSPP